MDLVELTSIKSALVGLPGVNGLSTEQRKRLTIAVELVANPSIILMDEPTSGLDARAAAIVMRTIRNTVDTGRTVVCTIHQPSIDIFEAFDEVTMCSLRKRWLNLQLREAWFCIPSELTNQKWAGSFLVKCLVCICLITITCITFPNTCTRSSLQLLLMKRGGRVVYCGPLGHQSNELIEYFEVPFIILEQHEADF